uniref:Uncharacterized protein n=1 Tax=Nelumbo nucifera TaxID=4432 RepID=A0A822Z6P9_NELNU|nr:TPA_asm: hypothetical protein HUJ06_007869 [Nelumbo nucifera]
MVAKPLFVTKYSDTSRLCKLNNAKFNFSRYRITVDFHDIQKLNPTISHPPPPPQKNMDERVIAVLSRFLALIALNLSWVTRDFSRNWSQFVPTKPLFIIKGCTNHSPTKETAIKINKCFSRRL